MTAVIVVDVYDTHWDTDTIQLLNGDFPTRINDFLNRMRSESLIIHSPVNCDVYYKGGTKVEVLPEFEEVEKGQLMWGDLVNAEHDVVWKKENDKIDIHDGDYVLFDASTIFSVLKSHKIKTVYLVGLHLDMCIMGNDWGAINLKKYGFKPVIVEDLVQSLVIDNKLTLMSVREAGYATVKCADIGNSR